MGGLLVAVAELVDQEEQDDGEQVEQEFHVVRCDS